MSNQNMKFLDVPQSGSWQANTHSHNRAGQYRRNRRSPVQPVGTGRRAFIRSLFSAAAQAWGGLTDAERAAWTSYANEYPRTDRLGQSITLTGSQMYNSIYIALVNAGGSAPTDPPVSNSNTDVSSTTFSFTNTSGTIAMVVTAPTGTSSDYYTYAFSAPVSAGVSFMKTFWQDDAQSQSATAPTDLYSNYVAQFGVPPIGSRVFLKLTPVNQYGVTGVPIILSAVVPSSS